MSESPEIVTVPTGGADVLDRYVENWYEMRDAQIAAGPEIVDMPAEANLPYDLAAYERSVCGAMWLWPEEFILAWKNKVTGISEPGKNLFTFDRTREFFKAALKLRKRGLSIDPITLAKNCDKREIEAMGGMLYAMQHAAFCFCLKSTLAHLDAMIAEFKVRHFKQLLETAMDTTSDTESLNNTISLLNEQSVKLLTSDSDMITPTVDVTVDIFDKITKADAEPDTIPTTFRQLANSVGDYRRGQITLVGAPPANGKTAFSMQEIETALMHGFTVDAFLMESSLQQYTERFIARRGVIHGGKFKTKFFTQDEYRRIHDCMEMFTKFENRLHLAKMGSYTSSDIDAMIQQRKAATGLPCDLIVIDHLNRMKHVREKGQSEYDAAKSTLQHLSTIAARENAVMLLMDQLTVEAVRNSFGKGGKFPSIGAFRGGVVTEYAKVVLILFKDEQEMLQNSKPVVEQYFVVCKANDGASGAIPSLFLKPITMHIEDCDIQQRLQYKQHLEALGFALDTPRKAVK